MAPDELASLREKIAALDRAVLDALNERLELVQRVRAHKQETGTPQVDAAREAELLDQLVGANAGPLGEGAVRALFSAVLDVMKQEAQSPSNRLLQGEISRPAPPVAALAVVGTGLVGTSVALAARRAGVARVAGWDADDANLQAAAVERAPSLEEAVAGAELVVVAVPVGALADTVRRVLAAAPGATVTDVGSTKRALAGIDDPRFVAGHPIAGGSTGGPARASADLFDGAVWFLTPSPAAAERAAAVERFVSALGARPVRLDPERHDAILAVTSHLPHVVANLLMRAAAAAGDDALGYAAASLREMTRVAGANPVVWSDIFVENGDLIAAALDSFAAEIDDVVAALRSGDRAYFERWIADVAAARTRMLEFAYRTDAKQLNRIRVRVPDKPGVLARITQTLGAAGINIEDFELRHVSPEYGGVLVILVAGADNAALARTLLRRDGYAAA